MLPQRLLPLLLAGLTACSRSSLDVAGAGAATSEDAGPGNVTDDGGPQACAGDASVGVATRFPALGQSANGVVDPLDDLYLLIGGISSDSMWAESMSGIDLGTGTSNMLPTSGDGVSLGPILRAVWEPVYGRTIILGGGTYGLDSQMMVDDSAQVFAVTIAGGTAQTKALPKFPESDTNDIPLPAAADPASARIFAIADKGSLAGAIDTWVLDATPGGETWTRFDSDASEAVSSLELVSLSFDAIGRRLLGLGVGIDEGAPPSMWALSIDAPSGWVSIPGIVPASLAGYVQVLGGGLPLTWDTSLCAFVVGATSEDCEYQFWRFDIGASFTATPLGVAAQPMIQYGRGVAGYDARRRNFVFGSAFDCEYEHDYLALSTDFVPMLP